MAVWGYVCCHLHPALWNYHLPTPLYHAPNTKRKEIKTLTCPFGNSASPSYCNWSESYELRVMPLKARTTLFLSLKQPPQRILRDGLRGHPNLRVRFQGDVPVNSSSLGRDARVSPLRSHLHSKVAPVNLEGEKKMLAQRRWVKKRGLPPQGLSYFCREC